MIRVKSCASAAFDSVAKSPRRLSTKSASAPTNASRPLNKPPCPAGPRDRVASPIIQWARLAPENHSEHKTDSERGHDRLGRIGAHILFGIVLKRAHAISGIAPSLFGPAARIAPNLFRFVAIFVGHRAGRGPQILRRLARVRLAA